MRNFVVYSFLILSVAVVLTSAEDGEDEAGRITNTLQGAGKAVDKGAAVINSATNKSASAIHKVLEKTASKVDEIRNQEPHEHGQGKLLPSAYSGATRLSGVITNEFGNVVKSVVSGARNSMRAIRDSVKYSARRLLPSRFRKSKETNDAQKETR